MAESPILGLPLVAASQAQKHVTVNEALRQLDILVQLSVKDRDLATPPGSPAEGDRYIVAASPAGDWSEASAGDVAAFVDGAWMLLSPGEGWRAWLQDEDSEVVWSGSAWVDPSASGSSPEPTVTAEGANGGKLEMRIVEEELTSLSGPTATSTVSFPNQCIILGCAARTTTAITGATSFDCGDGSSQSRFGGSLGIAEGSTNQGHIGPAGNYATTTVTLTANGGDFTGGAVRVALAFLEITPPTT